MMMMDDACIVNSHDQTKTMIDHVMDSCECNFLLFLENYYCTNYRIANKKGMDRPFSILFRIVV